MCSCLLILVLFRFTFDILQTKAELLRWLATNWLSVSLALFRAVNVRVLDHNQYVLLVRSNQNLILLGSHSQERQIICGIDIPNHTASFCRELRNQTRILDLVVVVEIGTDGNALRVHNNNTCDALVRRDSLQCFFYFRLEGNEQRKPMMNKVSSIHKNDS